MYGPFLRHRAPNRLTVVIIGQTQLTIDTLPDDALLYVFDFYLGAQASDVEAWHTLVHVCRRWRTLVFGSPRRLNLQIKCTAETPFRFREKLDVWPPLLPIVISCNGAVAVAVTDNIKAALERHDRVCQITLRLKVFEPEDIIPSLEKPFPILKNLALAASGSSRPFYPDPSKFLGGVAAHLRCLYLSRIGRIPDILKLLLCGPNLFFLHLDGIGFLPDEIVTVLSALTRLKELRVAFDRSLHKLESRCSPLLTRAVLPSLAVLTVRGDTKNLEKFMARIDSPLLERLYIHISFSIFDLNIVLDTPHLLWFISRIPNLQPPFKAQIGFCTCIPDITFFFPSSFSRLHLEIIGCAEPERQFPCLLAQFHRSAPFSIHPLTSLAITGGRFPPQLEHHNTERTRWLEALRQFPGVKNLYLTKEIALHIAHALQELVVGERVMEVLPILENVFVEEFQPSSGPVHEAIKEFSAARQLAGHPITISNSDAKNPGQDVR